MESKYRVNVNESFDFEFLKQEIEGLDVQKIKENEYHVLQNQRSVKTKIVHSDFLTRRYVVSIHGNDYNVSIADELDLLIEKMGLSLGSSQTINEIKAPMPGLILEVNVNEGDQVNEGDYLLVLEAMKMENALTAPRDGVVKSIAVKKGGTVEKNQLLIEME